MNGPSAASLRLTASIRCGIHERVCPDCNGFVYRVQRRFIDRLISLIFPVQRYRCSSLGCHWEGNLRKAPFSPE